MTIDSHMASSTTTIVGAVHLGETLGKNGFKKTLCADHLLDYNVRLPWFAKYLKAISEGKEMTCHEPPDPMSTR